MKGEPTVAMDVEALEDLSDEYYDTERQELDR